MSSLVRWLAGIAVLAVLVAAGLWVARESRQEQALERQREEAIKVAARVSTNAAGETVVRLDREAQARVGIRIEAIAAAAVEPEVTAYGRLQEDPSGSFVVRAPATGTLRAAADRSWPSVGETLPDGAVMGLLEPRLSPAERIGLLERLAAARAETASTKAALAAARAAFERARTLNADNKNVSDRVLEEAEARLKGEDARATAAEETLRLLESAARNPALSAAAVPLQVARGGQVVEVMAQPGESIESGQPVLRVARFDWLIARVDVPVGQAVAAEATSARLVVLGHESRPVRAERIALAASVDPNTQGQPLLFRVPGKELPLRPGWAVKAYLRAPGPLLQGVVIPPSAVVHMGGRTWVYVRAGEEEFVRKAVTLERLLERGWFVPAGPAPGDRVVVTGTQVLLSEESKSQIRVGEEGQAN